MKKTAAVYLLALLAVLIGPLAWSQPGPGPVPGPWKTSGSAIMPLNDSSALVMGSTVPGGNKGSNTINAMALYAAGNVVGGAPVVGNQIYASPNGSTGAPSFRSLVAADIPTLGGLYCPLTGCTLSGAINAPAHEANVSGTFRWNTATDYSGTNDTILSRLSAGVVSFDTNTTVGGGSSSQRSVAFTGSTSGSTTVQAAATASGTLTLPTAGTNLLSDSSTATVTGKSMAGNTNTFTVIPNSALVNPSTTVNGQTCTLGSSCSVTVGAAGSTNQVQYNNGGALAAVPNVNNGVLVTSGSGVPSISTTLPAGIAITKITVQKFTTSGTYTPTANMAFADIQCVGGGGGGAGVANIGANQGGSAGAGGAGGYSRVLVTAATVGGSQTVTIGAKGTGGAAGSNNGNAGTDTSVGTLCVGKGGAGGTGAVGGAGGAGGVAGTGDTTIPGQPGGQGFILNITGVNFIVPAGGMSFFGGGTAVKTTTATVTGTSASGFGNGGSSGSTWNGAGAAGGGDGSPGYVVITEYDTQ